MWEVLKGFPYDPTLIFGGGILVARQALALSMSFCTPRESKYNQWYTNVGRDVK